MPDVDRQELNQPQRKSCKALTAAPVHPLFDGNAIKSPIYFVSDADKVFLFGQAAESLVLTVPDHAALIKYQKNVRPVRVCLQLPHQTPFDITFAQNCAATLVE